MIDAGFAGARIAAASFFVVAAVVKLVDPQSLTSPLAAIGFHGRGRVLMARLMPVVELAAGALLLAVPTRAAVLPAAGLLLVFTVVLFFLSTRAPTVECGCLGDIGTGSHSVGISRNIVLGACLGFAAFGATPEFSFPAFAVGLELVLLIWLSTEGVAVFRTVRAAGA